MLELSCTGAKYDTGIEIGHNAGQVLDELVGEDVLANRDEESAAKSLEEHHGSGANGNVFCGKRCLNSNQDLLHTETDTSTEDELVANPLRGTTVDFHRCEQTGANGHEDRREEHERRVVTNSSYSATSNHRNDDEAEDGGEVHNSRLGCRSSLDGLEPDGQVVNHDEEASAQHGTEQCRSPDVAVQEDARRNRGIFLLPPLDSKEAACEENKEDQERNDATVLPLILAATPLESEQQANNSGQEASCSGKIELLNLLTPCSLDLSTTAGNLEEGDDKGRRDGTKGKVDVEAHSPVDVVSKGTAHQRASNGCDTVHSSDNTHVRRTLAQRYRHRDDQDGS